MNEPHMAPWWFPANDHPRDKARVDISITVPDGRAGLSNGARRHARSAAHDATWHWSADEPMVPYLAFFAAGDFAVAQGAPRPAVARRGLAGAARGAARTAMRLMKKTPASSPGSQNSSATTRSRRPAA